MKIKFLSVALGIILSATVLSANAQKAYTEGVVTYKTNMRGQDVEIKQYFKKDSSATTFAAGPAKIKLLTDADHKFFAVIVDVSAFNVKKAAIYTPDEIDQVMSTLPALTFAPGTETKQISGFNCTKVVAKDSKSGKTYDVWVTKDVKLPETAMPYYYKGIDGFPIQYTGFNQGEEVNITIKSITADAAPAGIYAIGKDFEKGTMADLTSGQ